jgi:3-oxoacyl-[acyl-carrier-protein] synthase II
MDNPPIADNLSPTKKALLALKQMQQKLEASLKEKYESIAVIGMGCRFPGADNPEAFWQLLCNGVDAIAEVPPQHWDAWQYYHPNFDVPGKICTVKGGFVPNLQEFDASFFRIAPKEAVSLDPQQRLLLEVSWEALENAAIAPESLKNSQTGAFIGICSTDYWHKLLNRQATEIDAYLTTGNTHSLASGRISHFLGLTGASISLDTACSSSLVAVHLAIQNLRDRSCNLAIVGGVNRIISSEVSINFTKAKMLSPDGRCQTFDDRANGFVRSEGCGVIILKRLGDAIEEGDRILAVLQGSAVNQDGRTSSITTPSSLAQQAVIRQALANSRIESNEVSYIETHGTGTSLGDSIEVEALSAVFGDRTQPIILGAVKTNIGHTEGASGIAGLIKTILAIQNKSIPANLHLKTPNHQINWQNLPFELPARTISWNDSQPRIAGVSAFGFSGTNAHVIVAEAPTTPIPETIQRPLHIFTLSARNDRALRQLANDYFNYLQLNPESAIEDICFTANTGRTHFNCRLALIVSSTEELGNKLNQFTTGQKSGEIWQGKINSNPNRQLGLILGNLENERLEMGERLYATLPQFQQMFDRCRAVWQQIVSEKQDNKNLQAFTVAYSLAKLWQSWGIEFSFVGGYGLGEFVAATIAGIFQLETALQLIASLGSLPPSITIDSQPQIPLIADDREFMQETYWRDRTLNFPQATNNKRSILTEFCLTIGNSTRFSSLPSIGIDLEQADDWQQLMTGLAELYIAGIDIDWLAFSQNYAYRKISLPTYPFQRQKYWLD